VSEDREKTHRIQRDAIWKWRWLGLRDSTPGFKGSLLILAVAAGCIVVLALAH
jgi:hypothetical protein